MESDEPVELLLEDPLLGPTDRVGRLHEEGAHGWNLYTGNVSFRREDYVAVGGFDPSLKQYGDDVLGRRLFSP